MRIRLSIALIALLAASCGGDGGEGIPFDGSSTSTSSTSATTTDATTTTAGTPTTTTAATTTTAVTTTTTLPETVFRPDGLGWADFGVSPEAVLTIAETLWGPPSNDSGWLAGGFSDFGVCPGSEFRQVAFMSDTLTLMFSDAEFFAPGGVRNFVHWSYFGAGPVTAGPPTSIDIGTTVAQLTSMWPGVQIVDDDPLFGPSFSYSPSGAEGIYGTLTGIADGDTITFLQGGVGCGE